MDGMNPLFFVSDAHLGFHEEPRNSTIENRLLEFFSYVEKSGSGLYILGDLFDFWFEYAHVFPGRHLNVLFSLKRLVDRNIPVHYIAGNHDFCIGDFMAGRIGIQVHQEPMRFVMDGKRFFLAHGDGIAKKDASYRIFKSVIRHPVSISLFRLLHPDLGFFIAQILSRVSRNHRPVKNRDAAYAAYAESLFREGFDFVLMGHIHRPQEHRQGGRVYVNTGDFMDSFTFAVYQDGQLNLKRWPLEAGEDSRAK